MTSDNAALNRIRELLAEAEASGVTVAEAEAVTAEAAGLMARYGIDRALLAAALPETDQPADRIVTIPDPQPAVRAHLLGELGEAMRCRCILLDPDGSGSRVHIFGYRSDIERVEVLYTSLLAQMRHALGRAVVPAAWASSPRAWRRSWLLGYCAAVIARARAAEQNAASHAAGEHADGTGQTAAIILASREQIIAGRLRAVYPVTDEPQVTVVSSGYGDGYRQGARAGIGGTRPARPSGGSPC